MRLSCQDDGGEAAGKKLYRGTIDRVRVSMGQGSEDDGHEVERSHVREGKRSRMGRGPFTSAVYLCEGQGGGCLCSSGMQGMEMGARKGGTLGRREEAGEEEGKGERERRRRERGSDVLTMRQVLVNKQ